MPRQRNWPPIPHVHKASGQERVSVEGRHVYLGRAGSAEARRAYAELLARLTATTPPRPVAAASISVAEVVERFGADARLRHSDAEAREYDYASRPLVELFAGLRASEFGVAQLGEVRDAMIRRGWVRAVINRRVVRVRSVWRWAEGRGLVPAGAWAHLRALAPLAASDRRVRESTPRTGSTLADLECVAACAPAVVGDILRLCWWTGARPGELRQLRAGEVDTLAWAAAPSRHKNAWRGKGRVIVLGEHARAILAPYLQGRAPDDFVFRTKYGDAYTCQGLCQAINHASQKAGVKLIAYQGRHAAKERITRELSLDHARAMLGQSSLEVTAGYGAAQDLQLARSAAEKCG